MELSSVVEPIFAHITLKTKYALVSILSEGNSCFAEGLFDKGKLHNTTALLQDAVQFLAGNSGKEAI